MALAAETRGPSRLRLPWVLLALSLALNLFFIGGAMWARMHGPPSLMNPAHRAEAAARELQLNDAQRAAFEQFVRTIRMRARQLRELNRPIVEQAWRELAKPKPDEAMLTRLFDEATANRRSTQGEVTAALRHFLQTLAPEQRERYIEMMLRRPEGGPQPFGRGLMQ